ncbi:MAG: hypothetical protein ACR2G2_10740 [Pseudonocardia sp.]
MTWVVEFTLLTHDPLIAADFERLDAEAPSDDWLIGPDPDHGLRVTAYIESGDPQDALHEVRRDLDTWLIERGLATRLLGVRVLTEEAYGAEAMRPDTPELMAATDVAGYLDISRQRVHQLRAEHPDFPQPYQQLGSGAIWTRPAIEHFATVWTRKPGRPSRKAS